MPYQIGLPHYVSTRRRLTSATILKLANMLQCLRFNKKI